MSLLNTRWTMHIVRSLLVGPKRFNELARINGINPRTLRRRLVEMEEQNLVTRHVISTFPHNVEYRLTPKGMALNCIIDAIADWGRRWMAVK